MNIRKTTSDDSLVLFVKSMGIPPILKVMVNLSYSKQ